MRLWGGARGEFGAGCLVLRQACPFETWQKPVARRECWLNLTSSPPLANHSQFEHLGRTIGSARFVSQLPPKIFCKLDARLRDHLLAARFATWRSLGRIGWM